jgi:galactofuranose transport system substrate-binding protein
MHIGQRPRPGATKFIARSALQCLAGLALSGISLIATTGLLHADSSGVIPGAPGITNQLLDQLNAPPGAVKLALNPGPVETTPLTHEQVRLMWGNDFPVPAGPIGNPNKKYAVCFSQGLVNNPWSTAQKESVMMEAARHSNLRMLYFNTNDPSQQIANLQTCANQHVDAILVWPQTVSLTPEIERLCKAGVTVVGMERTVPTHCFTSWVYLDYPGAVASVAEAIAKGINYRGTVVESRGTPGSSPEILRHYYFMKVMDQYPNIRVVETNPTDFGEATGYNAAIAFLHSPEAKNIAAWYAHYEEEAIGIEAALRQVKRTNVPVYTIGGTKQSICFVERGNFKYLEPGSATPLHGDLALRLAIMAIEGKAIPKFVLLDSPPAITPANAKEQYNIEGWGPGCSS